MSDTIRFEIVTPVRAVYSGDARSVLLPTERGEAEILPGHRAMLTLIQHGTVVVTESSGEKKLFAAERGYAEVVDNKVTLLVAGCVGASEVDLAASREDLARGEELFKAPHLLTEAQLEEERERLDRSRARLEMIARATGRA